MFDFWRSIKSVFYSFALMTSSKLKGTSRTNSRRRQNYSGGSSTLLDFLKNKGIKTASQTQIAKLKAQEAARTGPLRPNKEFWEENQVSQDDGLSGFDGDEDDAHQMTDVLEGLDSIDDSGAGDWQDIAGSFYKTDAGKRCVLYFILAFGPYLNV
jgi:hypothetical protein